MPNATRAMPISDQSLLISEARDPN